MRRRKRQRYYTWTTGQIARLKKCYPVMTQKELAAEFAPHPLNSILTMGRQYGLKRPQPRDWMKIVAAYKPVLFSHRVPEASQGPQGA